VSVRGYQLCHIEWAIGAEQSDLCTQDYLDEQATLKEKHYLSEESFQADVERARHFIFDELPALGGTEFTERLIYHLRNFTQDDVVLMRLINDITKIVTESS